MNRLRALRRSLWLGLILFLLPLHVTAQTGGQFCVRAFEDLDGNGEWAGAGVEPLLTRDVAVNLLNADGVVVDSGLLENSRTAAEGVICFPFLSSGEYTAVITSATLVPTTPMSVSAMLNETGEPVVVLFGANRADQSTASDVSLSEQASPSDSDQVLRVAISTGIALFSILGMIGLGILLYTFFIRKPLPKRSSQSTSLTIPPVTLEDTPTSRT